MAESIDITIPDPKTDVHIGEVTFMHINIRNIDTDVVTLKKLSFRPDAGILYLSPVEHPQNAELGQVVGNLFFGTKLTVYDGIIFQKDKNIEPGNEISITFPFQAGGLFRKYIDAGRYSIVFTIRYEKATQPGKEYSKVVSKDITVYYTSWYMIAGGIVGGILGVFFREYDKLLTQISTFTVSADILFGILVGFIIVIILKRKSNVQSFISVNDVWGGLLAGFIAGAAGKELIQSYLMVSPETVTNAISNLSAAAV
jgi:hypothetical protein